MTPVLKCDRNGFGYVEHASIPNKSHRLSFGRFGSAECSEKYQHFLAHLLLVQQQDRDLAARPDKPPRWWTIRELAAVWRLEAVKDYTAGGVVKREWDNMEDAVAWLVDTLGDLYQSSFGPKALLQVREAMIQSGRLARPTINAKINRIRRFWRWAASHEYADPGLYEKLQTVAGLRAGQQGTRDPEEVVPADLASLNAILDYCPPVVADMMRVQFFCVMRPAELCEMHVDGLDRSGDIWLYRPDAHKTQWRGKKLIKGIPKVARELLEPRLENESGYLFDPEEARRWGREQARLRRGPRKTPLYPSETNRVQANKSERKCSLFYSVNGYRTAIARACERARSAGIAVEAFSPNQIRRAAINWVDARVAAQDAAQKLAGHSSSKTTDIYRNLTAKRVVQLAAAVDEAFGE